jgi:hypothetical protein
MTPRARIAIIAVALAALVVAFIAASGSDKDTKRTSGASTTAPAPATGSTSTPAAPPAPKPKPTTPVVRVVGAKPQGGVKRLSFVKGDRIRFTVKSDTADEIHVHGYDVHKDVAARGSVRFSIPAKIEGRFVVELERHATQIAELEVTP